MSPNHTLLDDVVYLCRHYTMSTCPLSLLSTIKFHDLNCNNFFQCNTDSSNPEEARITGLLITVVPNNFKL